MLKRNFFLPLLALVFLSSRSFCQTYSAVDKHAASVGYYTDLDTLYSKLVLPSYSDSEKVRSFFYWITESISYDDEELRSAIYQYPKPAPKDSAERSLFYEQDYALFVLKRKSAVCMGYARLFNQLCRRASIQCIKVDGYGRTNVKEIGLPFVQDHSWNAVKLKNKWFFLDACWASGYGTDDTFIKERNEAFYLTPPERFILRHYPTDSTWTLIEKPLSRRDFVKLPHLYCNINRINPKTLNLNGTLKAKVGDTLTIEIELMPGDPGKGNDGFIKQYNAAGDEVVPGKSMPQYSFQRKGNKLIYTYPVWSGKVTLLELGYETEYMMAYKLKAEYSPKKPQ